MSFTPPGFKTFRPADEIVEDFIRSDKGVNYGMDPTDNLPTAMSMTTPEMAAAPALTPENLVCLGTKDRVRCAFYKRQLLDAADMNNAHKLVVRFCTARTDEDGAYMSLRDVAVYACDLRQPPDPRTAAALDGIEDAQIQAALKDKEREEETFDLAEALSGGTP